MADPANRKDRPGGGKFYEHPLTGEIFDSVTTVLGDWDKDGLVKWAGMLAADYAIEHGPEILNAALLDDCGNTYNRCYEKHGFGNRCERCPCGECPKCWYRRAAWRHAEESARRAQEGTEVHAAIEYWVLSGGDHQDMRNETQPYYRQFLQWAADYGLQPGSEGSWYQTECTLLNRDHMYAGTSDAAVHIRPTTDLARVLLAKMFKPAGALIRVDYKTREKPDERLYNDMPLQGVAYERCTVAMLADGSEHPVQPTDGRFVLQLRQENYSFVQMVSEQPEFDAFLGLLAAYRWRVNRGGKNAFGVLSTPPAEPKKATKRAAKKAAPAPGAAAADPFELARDTRSDAILAEQFERKGRNPFPAGKPQTATLLEPLPF